LTKPTTYNLQLTTYNNMHWKKWGIILSVVFVVLLLAVDAQAQCPMCRMSAESNMSNGGTAGKGLNTGILYMLAMPYLLVATMGFLWWRNRRKNYDDQNEAIEA